MILFLIQFDSCHKVNFKHGGSYIDSPHWLRNKKATINPKNENDKCFLYAATKSKESSYINYWDINNLYGWVMSQKLPTFNFKWVEDILQFTEVFINNCDKKK